MKLTSARLSPCYCSRWLRLLFTREFGIHDALRLWDGLYAYTDDIFELAQWVCVAMLLRIRNDRASASLPGASLS